MTKNQEIKKLLLKELPKVLNRESLEIIATKSRVMVIGIYKTPEQRILRDSVFNIMNKHYRDFFFCSIYAQDESHIHISIKEYDPVDYVNEIIKKMIKEMEK